MTDAYVTVTVEQLERALAVARSQYAGVVRLLPDDDHRKIGRIAVSVYGGNGSWSVIQEIGTGGGPIR